MKNWISAARLRTLPLAFSSILMGSFLAAYSGKFDFRICIFSLLTTLFLQVLSNFANDYGDSRNGADHTGRTGPVRMVQSGIISSSRMKSAIYILTGLSLISGITLLLLAFGISQSTEILLFLLLGLLAIAAAIKYTAGKNPYGYAGLGDLSVLLFFGFAGVGGTYYLQTNEINLRVVLPALTSGLLAVGVLNINNIRDIESDKLAGKQSIPVRIGRNAARWYHLFLLVVAIESALFYLFLEQATWPAYLSFLCLPLFMYNIQSVFDKEELDPYLKQLAISTLVFSILFGIGLNFAPWFVQFF